jgi:hypothetical protein
VLLGGEEGSGFEEKNNVLVFEDVVTSLEGAVAPEIVGFAFSLFILLNGGVLRIPPFSRKISQRRLR